MRRSAIEAVGGFEDRFEGMYEDQVFFLKMFVHCSILVDDRCLDRYRQHPGSHSSTELAKGRWSRGPGLSESRRRFLEWAESFLAEAAVGDPTLARRVRRELLPYRYPGLRPLWRLLTLGRRRR